MFSYLSLGERTPVAAEDLLVADDGGDGDSALKGLADSPLEGLGDKPRVVGDVHADLHNKAIHFEQVPL